MVSGSAWTDHGSCRGRLRSGCVGDGACRDSTDSECWCSASLRLSRSYLSHRYNGDRIFDAEPSGWLEAGRMVAYSDREQAASGKGLYAGRCTEDLAMVGIVAAPVPEYVGGHLAYF